MRVRVSGFDAARVSPRNPTNSLRLSQETLERTLLRATERDGVEIWHPYALLHYLKKPVDLLTLTADEQVITVPVETVLSSALAAEVLAVDRRQ